jgi:multisubunit Na+/H+ antiporter MnhG subunit
MRIGAGLFLIALGAVLRFGISTSSTHGFSIHTIGNILMVVGVLGVLLALVTWWAPWTNHRRAAYRDEVPPDEVTTTRRYRDEVPPGEVSATRRYRTDPRYEDEYRREV